MTDRRTFIASVASGLLGVPLGSVAQEQGKVWRIGFFYFGSQQSALETGRFNAFVEGMRELGYVDGKNVVIESRFGDGESARLAAIATELVRSRVDVIVATGSETYSALRHATTTIPIVVTVTADPVAEGLAASLARPGGNFTGLADTAGEHGPKQLQLLMAAVPRLARVGVLLNPGNVSHPDQTRRLAEAARKVGVQVVQAKAGRAADIEPGFNSLARDGADAVILFGDAFFVQQFQQIAQAALRRRMPSIAWVHDFVKAGGLMSYGAEITDNFRRAAIYVDKILKGAKAGELSFEQPTRYALAINLGTAKALGISIPQSLLVRADEVIE